jgi:plastocyanin
LLGLALAVLLAACTATTAGSAQPSGATDADVVITSQDLKFDVATLTAPAGSAFGLQLTNLDAAPHNVAIYRDSSASDEVFGGEVITSASIVYQVPALEPGNYFFRCDVHPDMNGTLVAG